MKKALLIIILLIGVTAVTAYFWQQQTAAQSATLDEKLQAVISQHNLTPLSNETTPNAAKIALGQMLFFDKELSGNRDTSCATCHHPQLATGDQLPLSIGTGSTGFGPNRTLGENRSFVPRHATELFNRGQA
jgi:cytochrome c peroxidase